MARAVWKGAVLAESGEVKRVDGYTYFPRASVRDEHLRPTDSHTRCAWKGTASYFDVVVDGDVNHDAAWTYPAASEAAKSIEGWIGFWHGVAVEP